MKWLMLVVFAVTVMSCDAQTDKKFLTVSAINAGAVAFDAYTTARDISVVGGRQEVGEPWLLGRYPSVGRIAGVAAGEFAITESLSYLLKRSHNRVLHNLWALPVAVRSAIHIRAGIHNLGVSLGSGGGYTK